MTQLETSVPAAAAPPSPPSVSILLVMKNERHNIERSFDTITGQDYGGPVEIVYIDSGSTDGTIEFMRERGIEPHVIPPEEFHHGRTRNLAASMAKHEILVLLSGDAIPASDQWLKHLAAPFEDPLVGGVYGKQLPSAGVGPLRSFGLEYLYPEQPEVRELPPGARGSLRIVRSSNANSAIRTEVWRRFKFHENVIVAEDHWVCYNLLKHGLKMVYEPKAAVFHGHERSIWGDLQFAVDNAISLKRMGVFDDPAFQDEFSYGMDRVRKEWAHFTARGEYAHALKGLAISVTKYVGVQLGKREAHLPQWFLRRISAGYNGPAK